jgi:hypothetical protein
VPLDGHVFTAPDGAKGFDADETIRAATAAAFRARGYSFCVRYVRRKVKHARDLTAAEARALLGAGLGLMAVQHVESESAWTPTARKGVEQGRVAAEEAEAIGIPPGVTVWCDLEGVATGTPRRDVIDYCNRWHERVAAAGYQPGLYVGWHAGLTPRQLYYDLRFTHYWGAYNLNADEAPVVRGLQMRQGVSRAADRVPGHDITFQTDRVRRDALGGAPTLLAPESWLD